MIGRWSLHSFRNNIFTINNPIIRLGFLTVLLFLLLKNVLLFRLFKKSHMHRSPRLRMLFRIHQTKRHHCVMAFCGKCQLFFFNFRIPILAKWRVEMWVQTECLSAFFWIPSYQMILMAAETFKGEIHSIWWSLPNRFDPRVRNSKPTHGIISIFFSLTLLMPFLVSPNSLWNTTLKKT